MDPFKNILTEDADCDCFVMRDVCWQEFVRPSYGDLIAAILSVYVDVTALASR